MQQVWKCSHAQSLLYAQGLCRSCYEKDLRARNPEFAERQRNNRRSWGNLNPGYKEDKEKRQAKNKARAVLRKGLRESQLQAQGGKCAICGTSETRHWHYDHNHETGALRGVLCSRCNNGLGFFRDDPKLLKSAMDYVINDGCGIGLHIKAYRGHNRKDKYRAKVA